MDELRQFFNGTGPAKLKVKKLRGPLTGGVYLTKEDPSSEFTRRADHERSVVPSGTDYAREVKKREAELYVKKALEPKPSPSMYGGLESLEQLTLVGESTQNLCELSEEAMTEVYSKYSFQMKEDTNNLAINDSKQLIIDTILAFPIIIIEGPTGCGKTTQVPQWILDDCYKRHRPCKIIVTQPRRIAAISIAKRVAQERGWDVGGLVGYQVGLENKTSNDTRIMYVTTGVLLQKLVAAKSMNEYTHIILDEVHERGQEMDFLLLVVKRLLYTVSPNVKVILMSATFNSQLFTDYFMLTTPLGLHQATSVKIERNEPMFSVKTFYLNHLDKFSALSECMPTSGEPTIKPEMNHLVVRLLNAFENIDTHEGDAPGGDAGLPSVLVFLPGIYEIEELYNCLTDTKLRERLCGRECASYKWWVLPLHSTITADEQVRVFQRAQPHHRKVILSTNIAESSITVPDVKYVIDFCLMKTLVADEQTNFTSLQLQWASKTNCVQRAGRAGRVRDGRVYRLVPDYFYETFKDEVAPEIIRCPLERVVLLSKMLEMGPPSDILALALDPPDMANIHRTLLVLKEMGALKKTVEGEWCSSDGDLTYLGRVMARLPLDVRASKLIVLGYMYGCLDECLIMAAAMSVKNLFSSPFRERLNAYNSKLTWADGSTSDCIAFLNVYKVWSHIRQQNYFKGGSKSEAQWARRFYVQARALREVDELVRELRGRLAREGIDTAQGHSPWGRSELPLVLKLVIAGAFYPQYFVQVPADQDKERDAFKTLGGLDPRNTVFLKGFPEGQPGEVYASTIKNAVRQHIGEEPRVIFDNNSSKVYLQFDDGLNSVNLDNEKKTTKDGDPSIPGQVVLAVYKAIKARQLKIDIRIPVLPVEKAEALAAFIKTRRCEQNLKNTVPRLPELRDTHFPLKICLLLNVGNFWVHYDDQSTAEELRMIHTTLNTGPLEAYVGDVACGDMYAANTGDCIRRVKVTKIHKHSNMVEALLVDVGSICRVSTSLLRVLPEGCEGAPLAMRCRLARVAPSPLLDARGHWPPQARAAFTALTARGRLIAKVYSVVAGVVAIELLAEGGRININQELLRQGAAVPCEESYESKSNHDLRESTAELSVKQMSAHYEEQLQGACCDRFELEPPPPAHCNTTHCLKGPYSPLETSLQTLVYASRDKHVHIEWNSVNSVLLDTDPQQMFDRLVVAGTVGQNESGSRLTLRHTTLLPNMPGLPAIVALLFTPTAEFRRSSDRSRYVSALCGLGADHRGRPYFPEHDLLVRIDADINIEDIGCINHIRHLMDYMVYCGEGRDAPDAHDEMRLQVPKVIRENLLILLRKRRKHRYPEPVGGAWEWRDQSTEDDEEVLVVSDAEMAARAQLFALHTPLQLYQQDEHALRLLKEHNEQLKQLVTRSSSTPNAELVCKLCNTPPLTHHAMRIHLYSNGHIEKEEDFRRIQD